jgi:hypothetical protein
MLTWWACGIASWGWASVFVAHGYYFIYVYVWKNQWMNKDDANDSKIYCMKKTDMKRMGMLTWRACGIAMWGSSVSVIHGCFFMQDVCIIKALMKTMKNDSRIHSNLKMKKELGGQCTYHELGESHVHLTGLWDLSHRLFLHLCINELKTEIKNNGRVKKTKKKEKSRFRRYTQRWLSTSKLKI